MPVYVRGVTEFQDLVRRWLAQVEKSVAPDILQDAAQMLIDKAKPRARVDTGFMQDHIEVTDTKPTQITVTSLAHYSIYNEEGTRYMSPQPFMLPAAMETEQHFKKIVGDRFRASTHEYFKKRSAV